jgi:hypothetical protein
MDAGYDAKTIRDFILACEHIPIIDPNKRSGESHPPLNPAKQERYKIRTTVERSNSHILRDIIGKGYTKISCVLMSAVVCLAAIKYLQCFLCSRVL